MSEPLLQIQELSFSYSPQKKVLKELSFELHEGEFLTLLGPNGCGKSTLMKLVSGVLEGSASGGKILYRGEDFSTKSAGFKARSIAYVGFDYRSEFPMTAYEAVMLARTAASRGFSDRVGSADREAVEKAMELCECASWRDQDLQTLSGGERQLVSMARALAQGAKILFLDESLSQMDLHHQAQMGKMLRDLTREGWSIVLVSHDVNLAAEWAQTALLMRSGEKIAHGVIREVLSTENLKLMFPSASLFVGSNPSTGAPKVFFGNP